MMSSCNAKISANLTGNQIPVSVNVGSYSPNLFQYMGVTTAVGPGIHRCRHAGRERCARGSVELSLLAASVCGTGDVVGKTIELDHQIFTVIGVVPPRFTWGDSDGIFPALPTADPNRVLLSFAKLKPGTNSRG